MRLSIVLILSAIFTVTASSNSQSRRVSLNMKDISFSRLFGEIRKQTNYSFFYNEAKIAALDNVTVAKNNVTVKLLLDEVLSKANMTYKMVDDVIIIVETNESQKGQSIEIKGTIADAKSGELLPGVNVMVKNSVLGTVSDANGQFKLVLPNAKATLVVSYMGYETQEINIDEKKPNIFVKLVPKAEDLGEVVITGYQVIDKRELTSSTVSLNAKDLDLVGSISLDRMLEGKAAGLMISNVSSTPGASAKVRVRSGSTFTGNQSPLWVVDGVIYQDPVPLDAADINSFDNVNLIGNALTGINPSDIEKIDILKDASATAIYGTRAANGVIVITTKRGKEGRPVLNYSTGISFVRGPEYSDMRLMNSKQRVDVSREMYERNLGFPTEYANVDRLGYEGALMNLWDGTYTSAQFQNKVNYLETLNTDWFAKLYRSSLTQQHSINVSGGSKNARYYFSLGSDNQQGSEMGVGLKRITARSNLDISLRDNVLLAFKLSGSNQDGNYNHSSINTFNTAYYTARTIPLYNEDGSYFNQSKEIFRSGTNSLYGKYNILREMNNSAKNITNKDLSISASLTWDFLTHFKFSSLLSLRNTTNLNEEWASEDTYYIAKLRTYDAFEQLVASYVDTGSSVPFGGVYSAGMMSQKAYTFRNQLNFNKKFGDSHVFNANLGQEMNSTQYWGATGFTVPGYNHSQGRGFIQLPSLSPVQSGGYDFANYPYDYMITWLTNNAGSQSVYPAITDRISNNVSLFGILNYVYDNRYVANFNIRSDGSNAFGQYTRYKFKPTWSASMRWNIHKEKFLDNATAIDELALRASYGVRGTMPNASPYLIISDYGRYDAAYFPEMTANLNSLPNANLRWEKSDTYNAGLNYSFFNGRISGALDVAYTKSTDLLLSRPVSLVNGTGVQLYNGGSKDVSSYEFAIRTVNIKRGKFGWSTNLNFSYDHDRVLAGFEEGATTLTVDQYLKGSIYRTGFPTNGFFSYQFDGLDSSTGLPKFKNLIMPNTSREKQLESMLVYEGSRVPLYYGGFGSEFKYGNFRLSTNFTYKLGYKTRLLSLYNGKQALPLPYENMSSELVNRWREGGDENSTNIPVLTNANMSFSSVSTSNGVDNIYVTNYGFSVPNGKNAWWMYDNSDARVVKGDHIRLQSLSLSYNISEKLLKKTGIKSLNIGMQASNVAVWAFDKKLKGQDPDQVNGLGLPSLSTYSLSLNMSL